MLAEAKQYKRKTGKDTHFGRIFGFCVLKGSELTKGTKGRKYKGRFVYQGNQVRDQDNAIAVFNSLSSEPATLEGSKAVDAHWLIGRNQLMSSDCRQAYVQTKLTGTRTRVEIPIEQWPDEWHKAGYNRPTVYLNKALYGHPDAEGHVGSTL